MSLYKGDKLIAGGSQALPLLFHTWADHLFNHPSWLRADTFSWHYGSMYQAVYAHLVADIEDKTLQSETVGDITIQFYLADDGHKICPDTEALNVLAIYNTTGVAWYYIIDTVNERFKLPRTKFGFTGLRDKVGGYVEPGLPNITGTFDTAGNGSGSGAFAKDSHTNTRPWDGIGLGTDVFSFNASRSNSIYGNGSTVQQPATQMYLYFYVGHFTQTAIENTAGTTAETLNNKVDRGHEVIEFLEQTEDSDYFWYRKYSDGWVEQGGIAPTVSTAQNITITLPVEMANDRYFATIVHTSNVNTNANMWNISVWGKTTTSFVFRGQTTEVFWQVSGMAA